MAGTGPPPNPGSRKSTSGAVRWLNLPAEGYDGAVPDWPFATITDAEAATWADAWRTPQAAAWARLGWAREVALYVRVVEQAGEGDLKAMTESRLRSLELGLTPTGMLKNHWRIADDEVAARRQSAPASTPVRRRLKVADAE